MRNLVLLLLIIAVIAGACRSDESTATTTASTTSMPMDDAMGDMNDMQMNMGDPDAVPAEEVPGAEVVAGTFALLDTRPAGYDDVAGTVALARSAEGTTVTIRLENLPAGVDFISHVHDGLCSELGGDHYKFDPAGSDMPPNEIHLAFTSAADGTGFMTAENAATVDDRARSVVVHPLDLLDNKIACAQFDG